MMENPKKRKYTNDTAALAKRARFPANPSRTISATPTTTAYPNGELNVSRFMRAHENEIKSLENAMRAAKKGLSRRAFQNVPRDLRRRTGSHNPQRVPKRLRDKARKEAKEDNTPISKSKSGSGTGKGGKGRLRVENIEKSKNAREKREEKKKKEQIEGTLSARKIRKKEDHPMMDEPTEHSAAVKKRRRKFAVLAVPDTPSSRFRRRQVHKTWLPTHIWHTKRATMTPGKEPLWRFAIPLRTAGKAYRLTHRAVLLRGAVAWDMSYMATIGLEGAEASIVGLLEGLHLTDEDGQATWQQKAIGKKWLNGTRVWEGWIYEREGKVPKKIAQVTVVWSVQQEGSTKRKAFIRVHPSAFLSLWNEVIRASKIQKPVVTVEDLRFEIGSIEIMGPASAETLCSVLSASSATELSSDTPPSLWSTIASVTNLRELPPSALLAFSVSDPRLRDPPRAADMTSQAQVIETLAYWPIDKTQTTPAIFDRTARLAACRSLPSQQSINRRKAMASPGNYPDPRPTDPQIPMLTFVSRRNNCWTVLLPWKCVLPVWRGIMRYPVSTGGNPRFGGLKERRQVDFERSVPSFPFDCPGTDAGWAWEQQERVERKMEWTKRPKGKRIEWATIDLGNSRKGEVGDPWACDWERLLQAKDGTEVTAESAVPPFRQILTKEASDLMTGHSVSPNISTPGVFSAKIIMVQRGIPTTCARIYRLPTNNQELRSKWLSLMVAPSPVSSPNQAPRKDQVSRPKNPPKHLRSRQLARNLLKPPQTSVDSLKASDENYPNVPDEEDLIGYVTTGNYNLAEGAPTAVANLGLGKYGHVCIWELV
ncbi:hypothetical protein K504DRAFT_482803 [Pleomassaria siparia CBS 279.74]|uniref:POPLD-domain-containing protein n=1 Tax=Pleomassaria siparia CBS 279.74 TaxID=1314801 RepID=A0A6G1K7Q9_9PLEO|nr:hypothetical protein K504DRAFT_482803 [Pleomassaria siparia CBS 279.74]